MLASYLQYFLFFHFRFPFNNPVRLRIWLDNIQIPGFWPTKSSRICSDHFLETDYETNKHTKVPRLLDCAAPSRNLRKVRLKPRPILAKSETSPVNQQPLIFKSLNSQSKLVYLTDVSSLIKTTDLSEPILVKIVPQLVPTSSSVRKNVSAVDLSQTQTNLFSSVVNKVEVPDSTENRTQNKGIQTRIETSKVIALKKKVKVLLQKIKRKEKKISCLKEVLYALKKRGTLEPDASELIFHYFDDSE